MKNIKKIISFISIAFSFVFIFTCGFTYAAYVYNEKFNQSFDVSFSYADKFGGGNGTQQSPYQISSPAHLRNLSKFTNMGCFDSEHHFALMNNIDWTNETVPLMPIGTIHTPFHSHFHGNGYYINKLQVVGIDLADVGMFGYVARSGSIDNFQLIQATITAQSSSPAYNYDSAINNIDSNPLRTYYTKAKSKEVSLTPVQVDNSDIKKGMKKFTINLPALPSGEKFKKVQSYSLTFSDKIHFSIESQTETSFTIVFNPNAAPAMDKDLSFTVNINLLSAVNVSQDVKEEIRICQYSVETYKLYFESSVGALICNPDNQKCYQKLFYPDVEGRLFTDTEHNYYLGQHAIYLGVIAGNMDGTADHILVYDSNIVSQNRPFNSNTILIGRHFEDDNDNTSKVGHENADFNEIYKNKNTIRYKYSPYQFFDKEINYDYRNGNRFVTDIYSTKSSSSYIRSSSEDIVRFYTTNDGQRYVNDTKDVNYDEGYPHQDPNTNPNDNGGIRYDYLSGQTINDVKGVTLRDVNVDGRTLRTLSFNDDMEVYQYNTTDTSESRGYASAVISNAMQFWPTSQLDGNWFSQLFSSPNKNIVVNINMKYILEVDPNIYPSGSELPSLKVLTTKKSTSSGGSSWPYLGERYRPEDFYINETQPDGSTKEIHGSTKDPRFYDVNGMVGRKGLRYAPHPKALIPDNGEDPSFGVRRKDLYFGLDVIDSRGLWKANSLAYSEIPNPSDGRKYKARLTSTNTDIAEKFTWNDVSTNGNLKIRDKHVGIEFNSAPGGYFEKSGWGDKSVRTPIIFFGIESPDASPYKIPDKVTAGNDNPGGWLGDWTDGTAYVTKGEKPRVPKLGYHLNILRIDVTLSDIAGNVMGTIATIDFGEGKGVSGADRAVLPNYDNQRKLNESSWPKESGVKIQTEFFKTTYKLASNDPNFNVGPADFTVANNVSNYKINAYRNSSDTITVNYTIKDKYTGVPLPVNIEGFDTATITEVP